MLRRLCRPLGRNLLTDLTLGTGLKRQRLEREDLTKHSVGTFSIIQPDKPSGLATTDLTANQAPSKKKGATKSKTACLFDVCISIEEGYSSEHFNITTLEKSGKTK